jgi:hypothetical protein
VPGSAINQGPIRYSTASTASRSSEPSVAAKLGRREADMPGLDDQPHTLHSCPPLPDRLLELRLV